MSAAPRTTLVLSGGGAKAAAHLGVAQVLADAGIAPTHYVGTSMGAVVAVLLAAGGLPRPLVEQMTRLGRRGMKSRALAGLLGLHLDGLLQPAPFRAALEALLPVRRFADLRTPCTVTAVDLDTGRPVCFGTGGEDVPLADALMASTALPVFLPPVHLGGRRLADGGCAAVLPLDEALLLAPAQVIAVDVGPRLDEEPVTPARMPAGLRAHVEMTGILMATLTARHRALWAAGPDRPPLLVVTPRTERNATFAVEAMPRFFSAGEAAMRAALADPASPLRR